MTTFETLERRETKRLRNIALGTISLGLLGVAAIAYDAYEKETQRLKIIAGAARAKLLAVVPNVFSLTSEGVRPDAKVYLSTIDENRMVTVSFDENGNNRIDDGEQRSDGYFTRDEIPDATGIVLKEITNPDSALHHSRRFEGIKRDFLRLIFGQ